MNELNIYVCENFYPDFKNMLLNEVINDIKLIAYPNMCETKRNKSEALKLIQTTIDNKDKGLIICSKQCDIIKLLPENAPFQVVSENYCFQHLANEQFIDYIIKHGGYIIGSGWLNDWKTHITNMGFNQETARKFYKEFCKELIFFDTGSSESVKTNLEELSDFVDVPYAIITSESELVLFAVKSEIYKWRLQKASQENSKSIREAQMQCSEYSALLDVIGKISSDTNKRDAIEKIKNIFLGLFGSQEFKYHSYDLFDTTLPEEVKNYFADAKNEYLLNEKESKFFVMIKQSDNIHGLIEVGGFIFPQYIEKYLNFAIEICKVSGLVLSNIGQYEKIMKSESELKYLSSHDALTGLYNRTYVIEVIKSMKSLRNVGIISFDIDKLKYVNDEFGHGEGDKLIKGFVSVLKICFRENDTVARIGGDEFVAIVPECDLKLVDMYKNRIKETIQIYNKSIKEKHLKVSASFGIAIGRDSKETYEELLNQADKLMYKDKFNKR